MASKLKAPAIKHYASWMKRLEYHHSDYTITYDEATYPLLDKLFELIRQIEPASETEPGYSGFVPTGGPLRITAIIMKCLNTVRYPTGKSLRSYGSWTFLTKKSGSTSEPWRTRIAATAAST